MNQIEFKNLIGRAGRIEYNLYGNIFIVRDKLIADKTLDKLLSREIDEPKNALLDNMPIQYKEYIVNKLIQGSTQFMIREGQDEEKYDMMRKEEKQFRIMPIAFKVKGRYPKEFIE